MRQIVLDTETTGFGHNSGDRIIEIGCVEMIDRKITGKQMHAYINPERNSSPGALQIHGLTTDFLQDKPKFAEVADQIKNFIAGDEIIAHNSKFDMSFLHMEYQLMSDTEGLKSCSVVDSLAIAKNHYPGMRNNLDALCKRFEIDNSKRDLHGALIDALLLAKVYLLMTGGQKGMHLEATAAVSVHKKNWSADAIKIINASEDETNLNNQILKDIQPNN